MFGALLTRLVFLGFIAWLVMGYVLLVRASDEHRDRVRAGCRERSTAAVARVRVSAVDVRYAHEQDELDDNAVDYVTW